MGHPGPEPRHPQPSVAACEGGELNEGRDQPVPIGMKHSYAGAVKGTQGATPAPPYFLPGENGSLSLNPAYVQWRQLDTMVLTSYMDQLHHHR